MSAEGKVFFFFLVSIISLVSVNGDPLPSSYYLPTCTLSFQSSLLSPSTSSIFDPNAFANMLSLDIKNHFSNVSISIISISSSSVSDTIDTTFNLRGPDRNPDPVPLPLPLPLGLETGQLALGQREGEGEGEGEGEPFKSQNLASLSKLKKSKYFLDLSSYPHSKSLSTDIYLDQLPQELNHPYKYTYTYSSFQDNKHKSESDSEYVLQNKKYKKRPSPSSSDSGSGFGSGSGSVSGSNKFNLFSLNAITVTFTILPTNNNHFDIYQVNSFFSNTAFIDNLTNPIPYVNYNYSNINSTSNSNSNSNSLVLKYLLKQTSCNNNSLGTLYKCNNNIESVYPSSYLPVCPTQDPRIYVGLVGLSTTIFIAFFLLALVLLISYFIWYKYDQVRVRSEHKKDGFKLNNKNNKTKSATARILSSEHNTTFKQQRLNTWTPVMTPGWVVFTYMFIAVIFIPLGCIFITLNSTVIELSLRYDNLCLNQTKCNVMIHINEDMPAPVYMYYKLTNFYANHRRFVQSRSDKQLRDISADYSQDCAPLTNYGDAVPYHDSQLNSKILYPCGLIAQSMFNDDFSSTCLILSNLSSSYSNGYCYLLRGYNWAETGIAWPTDLDAKFIYRPLDNSTETNLNPRTQLPMPPVNNEHFVVWMRTAISSTFGKLNRINQYRGFRKGEILNISINNLFDTQSYSGEKHIVLSTVTSLGTKNPFLGGMYLTVGGICFLLGGAFYFRFKKDDWTL